MTAAQLLEAAQALELAAAKLRALAGAPSSSTGAPAPQRRAPGDEPRAPFGRSKGELLSSIETRDLQWLVGAIQNSLGDPDKARYRSKNERDLEAVRAELEARALGTPAAAETPGVEGGLVNGDDDIPF